MPKVIHETSTGIKFNRKTSKFIFILQSPNEEQTKGLFENRFLYGIKFRNNDGSEEEIVDLHSFKTDEVKTFLHDTSRIIEYSVFADKKSYTDFLSERKREKDRERSRVANMSEEAIEAHRRRNRIAHMSVDAIEAKRHRHRIASMDQEEIQAQRHRHQIASMDQEAIQAQRQRHQVAFMDEPTVVAERERNRTRERKKLKVTLQQEWDYDNPCEYV